MSQHTVRTFDQELRALDTQVREMGIRTERQHLHDIVEAYAERDAGRAP